MHPAHYITEAEVQRVNDYIQQHLAERKARLEAPRTLKPLAPTVYADCYAARDARLDHDTQPNAEKKLDAVYEYQNELFELEAAMLHILKNDLPHMSKDDADHAKRKLLGYEVKSRSVPGELDKKVHVAGELEKCREKLAEVEEQLPRLKIEAARYAQVRESLKPWPWVRINRERNAALDTQSILNGRLPSPRGNSRNMAGYTITP
jgi:hypothetical protein